MGVDAQTGRHVLVPLGDGVGGIRLRVVWRLRAGEDEQVVRELAAQGPHALLDPSFVFLQQTDSFGVEGDAAVLVRLGVLLLASDPAAA